MWIDEHGPGHLHVRSTCKLNLFLEVVRRRDDGYHDIETLFQEIDLADSLQFQRISSGIEFYCNIKDLAPAGTNLVERAAAAFFRESGIPPSISIRLEKKIPAGAGVGGGSANATATLESLNRIYQFPLNRESLAKIACSLGADCPFFLVGGAAIGRGRGENLERVVMPRRAFLLVIPPVPVSTAAVYSRMPAILAARREHRSIDLGALQSPDITIVESAIFNRLEAAAIEEQPQLRTVINALHSAGIANAHVTGSGSGIFAVFSSRAGAERAAQAAAPGMKTTKMFVVEGCNSTGEGNQIP